MINLNQTTEEIHKETQVVLEVTKMEMMDNNQIAEDTIWNPNDSDNDREEW